MHNARWHYAAGMGGGIDERLRWARIRAGFKTGSDAARRFGWTISTYLGHENGTRGVTLRTSTRYAKAYKVSHQWLIRGEGRPDAADRITVVGYTGAGETVVAIDDHAKGSGLEEVDRPPGLVEPNVVAVRIRGNSMRPLRDGWLIFYRREQDGVPDDCVGRLCVVKLRGGEVYLKELRRGYLPGRFNLESWAAGSDPLLDQDIEWAAPVLSIAPG